MKRFNLATIFGLPLAGLDSGDENGFDREGEDEDEDAKRFVGIVGLLSFIV